jgi:serine/threonine protein kinase
MCCLTLKRYKILVLFIFYSLGKGAYGLVYKAIDKKTKEFVAVKKVLLEMEN